MELLTRVLYPQVVEAGEVGLRFRGATARLVTASIFAAAVPLALLAALPLGHSISSPRVAVLALVCVSRFGELFPARQPNTPGFRRMSRRGRPAPRS